MMKSIILSIFVLLFIAAITTLPQAIAKPGGHLTITEVDIDYDNDTFVITGEQLDFGPGPLMVTLGGDNISGLCTEDFVTIPQTIECDLSGSGGLPADGDQLLVVANGNGESQKDEYALTFRRLGFDVCSSVYTKNARKGTANLGEAVANNKFVDVRCNTDDILVSCGFKLGGTNGGRPDRLTPASNQDLADHITMLESRPLGGASACRARGHETPVNGIGQGTGWYIESIAVCCAVE